MFMLHFVLFKLQAKLPKLVVPSELVSFNKRLSLNDAITIILRKIQVSSTLVKVLNVRREVCKFWFYLVHGCN